MFYNPKYVLQQNDCMRTKRYKPLTDQFTVLLVRYLFWQHKGVSTKLTQDNIQTASRIHFCIYFSIFQSHLSCLSLKKFANPKSYFHFHADHLSKTTSAIHQKPCIKSRSVVAPMRTKTQLSAILFSKWRHFSSVKIIGGRSPVIQTSVRVTRQCRLFFECLAISRFSKQF